MFHLRAKSLNLVESSSDAPSSSTKLIINHQYSKYFSIFVSRKFVHIITESITDFIPHSIADSIAYSITGSVADYISHWYGYSIRHFADHCISHLSLWFGVAYFCREVKRSASYVKAEVNGRLASLAVMQPSNF